MARESFSRYQSYTAQIERRKKLGKLLRTVLLIMVVYTFFQSLFFRTLVVHNEAMAPQLTAGDRVVSIPLLAGPKVPFFGWSLPPVRGIERGDLVELVPGYAESLPFWLAGPDEVLRFLTFNLLSFSGDSALWENSHTVKRIIGLPGDRIRVKDSIAYIQSAQEKSFLSEYELINQRYDVVKGELPPGWRETDPLGSGSEELVLGPGEYYVLGDNRGRASDSRLWGVVKAEDMQGLVVFQYWPLSEIGAP